jgi:hypothetical protein
MLERLKRHYGWRATGTFPHLNRTEGDTSCGADAAAIIRSRTRLDREIYDEVRARFP